MSLMSPARPDAPRRVFIRLRSRIAQRLNIRNRVCLAPSLTAAVPANILTILVNISWPSEVTGFERVS